MSFAFSTSSMAVRISAVLSAVSVAGLTPMTASPQPYDSPSRML